jgi:dihydroorotate dehydrogenase (NAD+) catalytic subunit
VTVDSTTGLPRYDIQRSYAANYQDAPEPVDVAVPDFHGQWSFCGREVQSPLGMPAGPLLNGRWILYYGSLGFDVLTYKTVRSGVRECYPLPNLVPVDTSMLTGAEKRVMSTRDMRGSWAVSFGMPSTEPEVWRRDIEWTRDRLAPKKLLSVSVVGTVQDGWTIGDLANDYAQCARWAVESGADAVEMNFSCPNVATCDGQLYQQPDDARTVVQAVKAVAGDKPVIAKCGHMTRREEAECLLNSIGEYVDALAMTNSVAAVVDCDTGLLFDGERRGICGRATLDASVAQTQLFASLIKERDESISIIGVGGASTLDDVLTYVEAGAECVHIATAAMVDPRVAIKIREECINKANHG